MGGGTSKRQTRRCEIPAGHEKAGSKGGYGIVPADVGALDASLPKGKEFGQDPGFLPTLRSIGRSFGEVFLKAPGTEAEAGLSASVEALKPLADEAAEKNLIIAIEPGASPLSQKGAFLAQVAGKLKHPALKLMPDFGKLKDNVYKGTQAMLPHTVTVSCKMHSFDKEGNPAPISTPAS